jgi:hypothetical protein
VRYLSGAQGRFQSPDPGNAGADPSNPQSWNGYAYVGNNPLSYTDPSGMFGEATAGGCAFGPEGCAIGAAVDIGIALAGLFEGLFGGGGPSAIAPSLATPSSPILQPSPDFDSQGWNEQVPDDASGSVNSGTLFGSGNTSPFVFSLSPDEAVLLAGGDIRGAGLNPRAFWSTAGFLINFLTGTGPKRRYYGPADYRTESLMKSAGFQQNMQKIAGACRAGITSGDLELGTGQGGLNLPYDVLNSPVGAQVGGYAGGTWSASGNTVRITIPNEAGTRSFFYHAVPNSPFSVGPMRTINQQFDIRVANPCSEP